MNTETVPQKDGADGVLDQDTNVLIFHTIKLIINY